MGEKQKLIRKKRKTFQGTEEFEYWLQLPAQSQH